MTMITPPSSPREKKPFTHSLLTCDYIHPATKVKCKKNGHFYIEDKYHSKLKYTCVDHLDDVINTHFSLKQTIRIKTLQPYTSS